MIRLVAAGTNRPCDNPIITRIASMVSKFCANPVTIVEADHTKTLAQTSTTRIMLSATIPANRLASMRGIM